MEIFPAGLAQTLFPAILLGVLVTLVATETLGWTFTGLVVPGYLASVALVAPRAAALMMIEALVTLLAVRLISDGAARLGVGSRFFGRERFFLLLALATLIRLGSERALGSLGWVGGDIAAHSIGLVLVPLMAHTLDKVGLLRGLGQLGALTAITGLLIALLVRATNLSLADLSLTFEDVAFSIERSPKAYVVLLAGALLAARANVTFGWDFHGIVVPGLLAVAWFEPTKVLLTLVEAAAALLLALAFLQIGPVRRRVQDGPRRLVYVFLCDAVLRMVVVTIAGSGAGFLGASDLYGFGYLLPTLLAVKIWQRASLWRVALPAAQVSLGGFLAGNALCFVLGAAASWLEPAHAAAVPAAPERVPFERAVVLGRAWVARGELRDALSADELERWTRALVHLAEGDPPAETARLLAGVGVEIAELSDEPGGIQIHEPLSDFGDLRGLGVLVARPAGRKLVVAVPSPLAGDAGVAAVDVAEALQAKVVAVSGRPRSSRLHHAAARLLRNPWALAQSTLGRRGWTWLELEVDEKAPAGGELRLGAGRVPEALDLPALRRLLPNVKATWSDGDAVLAAPAATWRELAARPCVEAATRPSALSARQLAPPIDGDDLTAPERVLLAEQVVVPVARGELAGACRVAGALGLSVTTAVDTDGARHAAVLPAGRRGATVIVRQGTSGGTIVAAPHPDREPYGRRAAAALYEALPGRALLLGVDIPGQATSYDAAGEALAQVFGDATTVVELRGGGRPTLAEGAVVAWGAPPGTPALVPAWIPPIEAAAARAGLPLRRWDGSAEVACCGDLSVGWRRRLARFGRDRHASIYLSVPLRERRFGPAGLEAGLAQAAHLGIPRTDGSLGRALQTSRKSGVVDPGTFTLLRRWAELRHAGDLAALARRPGVSALADPLTGEAFLIYAAGGAFGAVSLRDPGAAAAPTLELSRGAVPADAVARLRFGGLSALWRRP